MAGRPFGSSLGVGAWMTGATLPGSRAGASSLVTGTAQRSDQDGRARSSTGRSASSAGSSSPPPPSVRQRLGMPSLVIVTMSFSLAAVSVRVALSPSIVTSARAGSASSSAGPVSASSRSTSSQALASRSGSVTTVSKPSRGLPSAGNGSRSTGTLPSRAASSSASAGIPSASSRDSPRDQRTAPPADAMAGESLTATAAAKPTPNRPVVASVRSRLAEARSVASASTPAASSGAPVFAAVSVPSRNCSLSLPGRPARRAASAAFCASSTTIRSRYPPSA